MITLNENPITIDEMIAFMTEDAKTAKTNKKKQGKSKIEYYKTISAFDIETTSLYKVVLNKQAKQKYKPISGTMYIWQLGINGQVVTGRTWEEFYNLIMKIAEIYETNKNKRFVIYVHNLSFEFSFIQYLFNWIDLFAMSARNPVRCCTENGIEFRCSYALAGASLDYTAKNLTMYKINKLSGIIYDYNKRRGTSTPLSEYEIKYCIHDVLVVMAYIDEIFTTEKTDNAHIRMTKTGRVRNYLKKQCVYNKYSRIDYLNKMHDLTMTEKEYHYIKASFAGGFTHSNRYRTNIIIEADKDGRLDSYDLTSSYPAALCAFKYPSKSLGVSIRDYTVDQILELENKGYAAIFAVKFTNICTTSYSDTIISKSKCYKMENVRENNGRVLSADSLTSIITNIDLECISWFYEWEEIEIYNVYLYRTAYLPHNFIYSVLSLYGDKTKLKGVEGEEARYGMAKSDVNSIYGDTAMDINHSIISYNDGIWSEEQGDLAEVLEKYNNSNSRYNAYAWSTFCTAFARRNVLSAIHYIDEYCKVNHCHSDYIYSDTDSIKLTNHDRYTEFFNNYNKDIVEKIKACLRARNIDEAMAEPETIDGKKKPLGVWDWESKDQIITRFKTLGAKRYIYETLEEDGTKDIHITIAGVSKKKGGEYFNSLDDAFNEFTFGMKIDEAFSGRLMARYFDEATSGSFVDYLGNKQFYSEMSSVCLTPSDFSIKHNSTYENILKLSKHYRVTTA